MIGSLLQEVCETNCLWSLWYIHVLICQQAIIMVLLLYRHVRTKRLSAIKCLQQQLACNKHSVNSSYYYYSHKHLC